MLTIAAVSRLRNHDLGWFGWDQSYFVGEARRVAGGDFDVTGPLAVGVNIIGPLYSYILGGLLWVGGGSTFLALCNALIEVMAVGLVFVAARRLSGLAGAIAAAVTYASAPILIVSTRLIWNPSWLPALAVVGWWLVLRYTESPTRSSIAAVGFVAGLAPALHATGILHSLSWVFVIVLSRPSLGRLAVAAMAGILPVLPVAARALAGTLQVAGAEPLVSVRGLNDLSSTLDGIRSLIAGFPIGLADDVPFASLSVVAFHLTGALSLVGLVRGVLRRDPLRPVWLGLAATFAIHVMAASLYSLMLSWYYFMALVGPLCLGLAHAIPLFRGRTTQRVVIAAAVGAAVVHLSFVWHFDRRTLDAGYLRADGRGLALVNQGGEWQQVRPAPVHSIPLRLQRTQAEALASIVPGGTTAMLVSHGARAELWRAAGAEYMPADDAGAADWPWQFVVMAPGTRAIARGAFVRGGNTCVFDRLGDLRWTVHEGREPSGWDSPDFDGGRWPSIDLPRRTVRRSQNGPNQARFTWQSPTIQLRATLDVNERTPAPSLFALSLQGQGRHDVILRVNGAVVAATRSRALGSDVFGVEEWLFAPGLHLHPGANLLAIQVSGPSPAFDLDVFRVPCEDGDWYY